MRSDSFLPTFKNQKGLGVNYYIKDSLRKEMGIYSSSDAGRKFDADEYVSETQGNSFYGHIIRILADYHSQEGQDSYAEIDRQESYRILETAEYDSYGSLMEELSMLE